MKRLALLLVSCVLSIGTAHAVLKSAGSGGGGGGGGSGTVTSVGLTSADSSITITNTPITVNGNMGVVVNASNISTGTLPGARLPAFSGDVATTAGNTVTAIQPGAVTLADMANLASASMLGNATGSAAAPQALNPLAVANLMNATIAVKAVDTVSTSVPSGPQTVDGVAVAQGQTVLMTNLSPSSANGIYVVQGTGAPWVLAPFFPSGFVIAQGCSLSVYIQSGTANATTFYSLSTAAPITIGTTAQTWSKTVLSALTASSVTPAGTSGGALVLNGAAQTGTGSGGSIGLFAGTNTGSGPGGSFTLAASNGSGTAAGANGGGVNVTAGSASSTATVNANGGAILFTAGASGNTLGNGGNITFTGAAGVGSSAKHGSNIIMNAGAASGGAIPGTIQAGGLLSFQGGNLSSLSSVISGCSNTSPLGVSVAGQYTSGITGTCTVTVTLPAGSVNSFMCLAKDETTTANSQAATVSGTTLTIAGTTVTGDVIKFLCVAF
jgi:hypothetical protein